MAGKLLPFAGVGEKTIHVMPVGRRERVLDEHANRPPPHHANFGTYIGKIG